MNYTPARHDGLSVVEAPKNELVFNADLTHNDGLLAESFMKTGKVSFDAAMLRIKNEVRELRQQLENRKTIEMGTLGSFTINPESHLVYSPGKFVRPELFGLSRAALSPIMQMPAVAGHGGKKPAKKVTLRKIGIGAAVAAVIAAAIFIFPLDGEKFNVQTARMWSESGLFHRPAENQPQPLNADAGSGVSTTDNSSETLSSSAPAMAQDEAEARVAPTQTQKYYVVMGVFESSAKVRKATEILNADGFSDVRTLERYGRQHLYAASFSDKEEALSYLNDIRASHRAYRDAWILKY